ncbi:MAG TPA: YidB family protein, partial [Lysobacter sp.]
MLDALFRQAEQFGLGSNARRFIGLLVDTIFSDRLGGFAGFQERFERAGLGSLLQSWIGTTPGDNVLQPDQFSAGFGQQESSRLAHLLGVPPATVNLAGAAILPKLVGLLSSGGGIPASIPAQFASLPAPAQPSVVRAPQARASGIPGWLKWSIPMLILLGLLLFAFRACRHEPAATFASTKTTPAATPPAAQANARFGLENNGGRITVNGQLASDADRTRLMDALNTAFGAGNVGGDITVDANTLSAGWIDKLIALLPELKAAGL